MNDFDLKEANQVGDLGTGWGEIDLPLAKQSPGEDSRAMIQEFSLMACLETAGIACFAQDWETG
jgi:16S rRNA G1207 methylase RsmC